jgi:hypothetical protein
MGLRVYLHIPVYLSTGIRTSAVPPTTAMINATTTMKYGVLITNRDMEYYGLTSGVTSDVNILGRTSSPFANAGAIASNHRLHSTETRADFNTISRLHSKLYFPNFEAILRRHDFTWPTSLR